MSDTPGEAKPSGDDAPQEPVEIPHTALPPDVLRAVIESFVLREGTDYGDREHSLDEKVAHVVGQLAARDAVIMFDPNTESVDIQRLSARRRRVLDADE